MLTLRSLFMGMLVLTAGLFAAKPAQAEVQVLVQEIGPGGSILFNGNTTAASLNLSSPNFSNITLSFNSDLSIPGIATFATTYNITAASNAYQLAITVTYLGPTGNGIPALAGPTVNVSNSISLSPSANPQTLTGTTVLLDFDTDAIVGSTGPDSATSTPPLGAGGGSTLFDVPNLSEAYKVRQTFTISPAGAGTFPGTVTSLLQTNPHPIPAPPAIVLAALALPAFGLRRLLLRKSA